MPKCSLLTNPALSLNKVGIEEADKDETFFERLSSLQVWRNAEGEKENRTNEEALKSKELKIEKHAANKLGKERNRTFLRKLKEKSFVSSFLD